MVRCYRQSECCLARKRLLWETKFRQSDQGSLKASYNSVLWNPWVSFWVTSFSLKSVLIRRLRLQNILFCSDWSEVIKDKLWVCFVKSLGQLLSDVSFESSPKLSRTLSSVHCYSLLFEIWEESVLRWETSFSNSVPSCSHCIELTTQQCYSYKCSL